MAEDGGAASPYGSAATSLRDTAKWLFTGVIATAGAVFAGSSLTKLGSLAYDDPRLYAAIIGAVVGFVGLACLAKSAVTVLTHDIINARSIASAESYATVRTEVDALFRGFKLSTAHDMASLLSVTNAEFQKPADKQNASLLTTGNALLDMMTDAAAFLTVREKFNALVKNLWWQTAIVILGFGTFAWAANPPDAAAPPVKGVTLKIVD